MFGEVPEVKAQGPKEGEEDPIELDEEYHDPDAMVSASVLEHEEMYTKKLLVKFKDVESDREFWEDKLETLVSAKENL